MPYIKTYIRYDNRHTQWKISKNIIEFLLFRPPRKAPLLNIFFGTHKFMNYYNIINIQNYGNTASWIGYLATSSHHNFNSITIHHYPNTRYTTDPYDISIILLVITTSIAILFFNFSQYRILTEFWESLCNNSNVQYPFNNYY